MPAQPTPATLRRLRALHVDDEPLLAMEGKELLEEIGFGCVDAAFSAEEARFKMEENGYDFALLDVNLAGAATSLDLAHELLAKGTIIVFATGYNFSRELVGGFDAPVISKPLDETALRRAIAETLLLRSDAA